MRKCTRLTIHHINPYIAEVKKKRLKTSSDNFITTLPLITKCSETLRRNKVVKGITILLLIAMLSLGDFKIVVPLQGAMYLIAESGKLLRNNMLML